LIRWELPEVDKFDNRVSGRCEGRSVAIVTAAFAVGSAAFVCGKEPDDGAPGRWLVSANAAEASGKRGAGSGSAEVEAGSWELGAGSGERGAGR